MKLSLFSRKIISRIGMAVLALVVAAFALSFFVQAITVSAAMLFSLGVLLMSSVNCLKVYLIERTANKVSDMDDSNRGKFFAWLQYLLRYFLTVAVALATVLAIYLITGVSPFVNYGDAGSATDIYSPVIIGIVAGLFTMQIGVIATRHTKFEESPAEDESAASED